MNRFIRNFLVLVSVACTVFLLSGQVWAISIGFIPNSSTINLGEAVDVDIVISDLGSDNLADFNLDVNYNDAILSFTGYSLGSELTDPIMGQDDWSAGDLGGGVINISELSWLMDFSSQADTFTLATISFSGIGLGDSALSISNLILGDEFYNSLAAGVSPGSIGVSVAPVPEPSTMLLLGTGLLGSVFVRRKKRSI